MELRYGAFRGLFTGDIGEETEQDLLQAGALSDIGLSESSPPRFQVF